MNDPTQKRKYRARIWAAICLLVLLLIIPMLVRPTVTFAQVASTLTYTPSPYTPTITLTPSNTPTTIPTIAAVLGNREPITAANASLLVKYRTWQAHYAMSNGVVFIPNTNHLVSIGYEGGLDNESPIRLWDIQEDGIRQIAHFFETVPATVMGGVDQLNLSPDGTRIIAAFYGTSVWDSQTGKLIGRANIAGQNASILDATNQSLFIGSNAQFVSQWQIQPGIPATDESAPPLPDGYVFDPHGALIRTFQVDEPISQIAFSNETNQLFVLARTGRLLIYKPVNDIDYTLTTVPQTPIRDHSSPFQETGIHKMILNAASHEIIYMDQNWDVAVYDFVQNKVMKRFPWGKPVTCLMSSPDGKLLVYPDWDFEMTLHIFDMASQKTIAQIVTGQNILSCAFSWDSKFIATSDTNGQIVLWGIPAS